MNIIENPTYQVWKQMRYRCAKPNHPSYKYYGGRGISVCERWASFANFIEDMGYPEKGHEIDRINNNGNYNKENCRWVSKKKNIENSRFGYRINKYSDVSTDSEVGLKITKSGKYLARISIKVHEKYVSFSLGSFKTKSEARAEYLKIRKEWYGY